MHELEESLLHSKKTAPGPDGVYYQMINNLPANAKEHLLKIYNKLWQSAFVPHQWREAVVIPILKPEKNHSNPSNYRPISLTSCVRKSMKRIINRRL